MKNLLALGTAALAAVALALPASAAIVKVTIDGSVDFNGFTSGPFAGVQSGAAASMSFLLDSDVFMNSGVFPTRGYNIDKASWTFTAGTGSITLQNPYPAGQTPFFVLRNNDPAVDGFFISENVNFLGGLDTSITNADMAWHATYGGNTLSSLNILDAVGSYSLAGVSVFNWTIDIGPGTPMGMIYEKLTIEVIPTPAVLPLLALGAGVAGGRRRRK
jgi:hypothetical protein